MKKTLVYIKDIIAYTLNTNNLNFGISLLKYVKKYITKLPF